MALTIPAGAILAACIAPGGAPLPDPEHHARPRMIADVAGVAPGETFNLGVSFEIEPGWHLYWNGRNDSGFPVSIGLTVPEGYTADAPLWPAPERYLMPGDLLDHIYEGRVTLIIPVHAPAAASPGAIAEFAAHLEWMECSTKCLLADGDVSLKLPVVTGTATPSPDLSLFKEARDRLPLPLPEHPNDLTLSWSGGVLQIDSPGAEYLGFYAAVEGPALTDAPSAGESKSGRLTLGFEWDIGENATGAPPRVKGVLEIRRPGGTPVFYALDLAPGEVGGHPQPGPTPAGIR